MKSGPVRSVLTGLALSTVMVALSACAGNRAMPSSTAASLVDPESLMSATARPVDYRIGIGDVVAVSVFQMPDLSMGAARVDTSGTIQLPLLGQTRALGRTAPELAEDVRARLAAQYLQNPRVTVSVNEVASQKVTVDGSVAKPGVFEMKGRTTLMQAIAMAEGTSQTADLDRVAVFRTTDGQRQAAVFDLDAIRSGPGRGSRSAG